MTSASQMWLLGRVLPYEIGRYIPKKDKHWQNYFLLLVCWEGAALRDRKVHPQKGQTLAKLLAVVGLLQCTCTYHEYKVQLVYIM